MVFHVFLRYLIGRYLELTSDKIKPAINNSKNIVQCDLSAKTVFPKKFSIW